MNRCVIFARGFIVLFACFGGLCYGMNNGLARTPPMGWLSWERFLCNVDCDNDPDNCISERLYMTMADILVKEKYMDVGYRYVNIDDCWMSKQRDFDGTLQPNATRFPHGIPYLADYMHKRGLLLGIYQDCGTETCGRYPGSLGHFETDAKTFAAWKVDMLKLDGCYADPKVMDRLYPLMSKALNETGRPMVFSCSWPAYQVAENIKPNYTAIAEVCNMWRNFDDIADSWQSVTSIVDYYASVQDDLVAASGPGQWSDPDMLIIGNYGLSLDQARAQMALWAILAAPLFISADLRTIDPAYKNILQNRDVIQVNQDPLGMMGRRTYKMNGVEIWIRPVTPLADDGISKSAAVVFLNRRTMGGPVKVEVRLDSIGLDYPGGYELMQLFDDRRNRPFVDRHIFSWENTTAYVNPSGVAMYKFIARFPTPSPTPRTTTTPAPTITTAA